MRSKLAVRALAVLALVSLAIPVVAKPVSKTITLSQPAKMGQTQLEAGEYRLMIDGTKVTVQRGNQVLAQLEGQWQEREAKASRNAILIGSAGQVREIRFAGDRRVLILAE